VNLEGFRPDFLTLLMACKEKLKSSVDNTIHLVIEISGSHVCEYEDVFWHVAQCSLLETDRRFREAYCLHHPGSKHL
jgi:hypothetical protein